MLKKLNQAAIDYLMSLSASEYISAVHLDQSTSLACVQLFNGHKLYTAVLVGNDNHPESIHYLAEKINRLGTLNSNRATKVHDED